MMNPTTSQILAMMGLAPLATRYVRPGATLHPRIRPQAPRRPKLRTAAWWAKHPRACEAGPVAVPVVFGRGQNHKSNRLRAAKGK